MYYNNYSFLSQLQGEGLALNRALQTQKLLIGVVAMLSVACVALTLHSQRQRALINKRKILQVEPE